MTPRSVYFAQPQPAQPIPMSHLQRLYNDQQSARQAAQGAAQAAPPPPPRVGQPQPGPGGYAQPTGVPYPDARQKKLQIRAFDSTEVYVGLASGFVEWVRRFERQGTIAQQACDFNWSEDVKVDLLGHYLAGTTEKYFSRQVKVWSAQLTTLQCALERMLETFKTNIAPATKLFAAPKDSKLT